MTRRPEVQATFENFHIEMPRTLLAKLDMVVQDRSAHLPGAEHSRASIIRRILQTVVEAPRPVHYLRDELPYGALCGTPPGLPKDWPFGHRWTPTGRDHPELCSACAAVSPPDPR